METTRTDSAELLVRCRLIGARKDCSQKARDFVFQRAKTARNNASCLFFGVDIGKNKYTTELSIWTSQREALHFLEAGNLQERDLADYSNDDLMFPVIQESVADISVITTAAKALALDSADAAGAFYGKDRCFWPLNESRDELEAGCAELARLYSASEGCLFSIAVLDSNGLVRIRSLWCSEGYEMEANRGPAAEHIRGLTAHLDPEYGSGVLASSADQ